MPTLDDLAAQLRSFLEGRFGITAVDPPGPGSHILLFDRFGLPLTDAQFTGSGAASAADLLSHQVAARLADGVPDMPGAISGSYLAVSDRRLSRWYQHAVEAATGSVPASRDDFESSKLEARASIDGATLAVVTGSRVGGEAGTVGAAGVVDHYLATDVSPVGWFVDAAAWSSYDSTSGADSTSGGAPDGQGHGARVSLERPWRLSILPDDPPNVEPGVQPEPEFAGYRRPPLFNQGLRSMERWQADVEQPMVLTSLQADDQALMSPIRAADVDVTAPSFLVRARNVQDVAFDTTAIGIQEQPSIVVEPDQTPEVTFEPAMLDRYIDMRAVLATNVDEQPATTTSFELSFDYCLVSFSRPWWDDVFMSRRDWTIAGYATGSIASGGLQPTDAPITLVTTAMLVIRDLRMKADWSQVDRETIGRGASIGPFALTGHSFSSNEISVPGMQVAAWVCRVPPVLPPLEVPT